MKTINANTKQGRRWLEAYECSNYDNIFQCYWRPSAAKVRAFCLCATIADKENGHGLKVIGYSCHFFSVAWQTAEGLRVETAYNSYIVK